MNHFTSSRAPEIEFKQPSVPWTGFDVLLCLAVWFAPLLASIALTSIASLSQPQIEAAAVEKQDYRHPVAQLIEQSKNSPVVFLIVFLAAVVVAPIIEEFLFRMLLQGWLEAKFKQLQLPCASGVAIVIVSIFFAAIHIRNHAAIDASALLNGLVVTMVFSLTVFAAGVIYLTQIRSVRIADYLIVPVWSVRPRFFICVGCCLLVIVFCLALNARLTLNFPGTNVTPIPIFFFSLALGALYSRTQNLADCILLHASLNGISLTILWLSV